MKKIILISLAITACGGQIGFTGGSEKRLERSIASAGSGDADGIGKSQEEMQSAGNDQPELNLHWQLPCPDQIQAATIPDFDSTKDRATIIGNADLTVDLGEYNKVGLQIEGSLCAPQSQDRDIVLVIDVSGSNNESDPIVNNSCERLKAVERMMAELKPAAGVQMAAVTFGVPIVNHSGGFHKDSESLFDAMVKSNPAYQTPLEVYCNTDGGDTDFYNTLVYVEDMIKKTGRPGVLKEVYFTSDGYQTVGGFSGTTAANRLKTGTLWDGFFNPFKIIAIKLNINDGTLYQMASSDSNGNKYYADASSGKLDEFAKILAKFSRGVIEQATFSYRYSNNEQFRTVNLKEFTDQGELDLSFLKIDDLKKEGGVEFELKYTNNLQRRVTMRGSLNMQRGLQEETVSKTYAIPGNIEMEKFRSGGVGIGYGDTGEVPNVKDEADVSYVANITHEKWMAYTIEVAREGYYTFDTRYRLSEALIPRARAIGFMIDDKIISPKNFGPMIELSASNVWTSAKSRPLFLSAGTHTLKVKIVGGGFDLDLVSIRP